MVNRIVEHDQPVDAADGSTIEMSVLALAKPNVRFLFLFDDDPDSRIALMQTLGQFAEDQELNFTWYDAAVLTKASQSL